MKTSIFRVIAFLSILLLLSNIYFFGKVLNLREKIENLKLNDRKDVFFGNSLTAIPATNADFSFSEGYFASINDTILLDQYLNLGLFGNVEYNEFPTKFLYEFNYNDSSFLLIDKKYNFENTDFESLLSDKNLKGSQAITAWSPFLSSFASLKSYYYGQNYIFFRSIRFRTADFIN